MFRALLLVMPLALVACGDPYASLKPQWSKAGFTMAEFNRDHVDCDYQATIATAAIVNIYDKVANHLVVRNACMQSKGWQAS